MAQDSELRGEYLSAKARNKELSTDKSTGYPRKGPHEMHGG